MGGGQGDPHDPHIILGITPEASSSEIKTAYRKLAKKWHPDLHASAEPQAKQEAERQFRRAHRAFLVAAGRELPGGRSPNQGWIQKQLVGRGISAGHTFLAIAGAASCIGAMLLWVTQKDHNKQRDRDLLASLNTAETRGWEAEHSPEEVAKLISERKDKVLQHAVREGYMGALALGIPAMGIATAATFFKDRQPLKRILREPFISFHFRIPALCFYVSSATAVGFYLGGVQAIMPKGQLKQRKSASQQKDK